MLLVKNGHSADKLPDAARTHLTLFLGLNERQIDDVQKILGAKEFVTCNEQDCSSDAAKRILTKAQRDPCVAKVGDSMIVATKRDTIESIANKLWRFRLSSG